MCATTSNSAQRAEADVRMPGRVAKGVADLRAFCAKEKVWVAAMTMLVVVWSLELWAVQQATLVYPNETGVQFAFWAPKIRFLLDVMFLGTIAVLLWRRVLMGLVVASFFIYLGMVTYFHYFYRPISLSTILGHW